MIIAVTPTISIKLVSGTTLIFVPNTKEGLDFLTGYGLFEMVLENEAIALDALFYWVAYIRNELGVGIY